MSRAVNRLTAETGAVFVLAEFVSSRATVSDGGDTQDLAIIRAYALKWGHAAPILEGFLT